MNRRAVDDERAKRMSVQTPPRLDCLFLDLTSPTTPLCTAAPPSSPNRPRRPRRANASNSRSSSSNRRSRSSRRRRRKASGPSPSSSSRRRSSRSRSRELAPAGLQGREARAGAPRRPAAASGTASRWCRPSKGESSTQTGLTSRSTDACGHLFTDSRAHMHAPATQLRLRRGHAGGRPAHCRGRRARGGPHRGPGGWVCFGPDWFTHTSTLT